jgi:hypothetical protein
LHHISKKNETEWCFFLDKETERFYYSFMGKNLNNNEQKIKGRQLLIQMDLLKRYFGITARQVYKRAGVKSESYGNKVLHGRAGKPTLERIEKAIQHFKFSKKIKQLNFLGGKDAVQNSGGCGR